MTTAAPRLPQASYTEPQPPPSSSSFSALPSSIVHTSTCRRIVEPIDVVLVPPPVEGDARDAPPERLVDGAGEEGLAGSNVQHEGPRLALALAAPAAANAHAAAAAAVVDPDRHHQPTDARRQPLDLDDVALLPLERVRAALVAQDRVQRLAHRRADQVIARIRIRSRIRIRQPPSPSPSRGEALHVHVSPPPPTSPLTSTGAGREAAMRSSRRANR